jgi:hypothetical protein
MHCCQFIRWPVDDRRKENFLQSEEIFIVSAVSNSHRAVSLQYEKWKLAFLSLREHRTDHKSLNNRWFLNNTKRVVQEFLGGIDTQVRATREIGTLECF